jgi:hypothetical protein
MYCQYCLITPCLFIQWQEEIERTDAQLYPEENKRAKRFRFYRRMTRELYGHLGKGVQKPLPRCFVQGARDLYILTTRQRAPTPDSSPARAVMEMGPLLSRQN